MIYYVAILCGLSCLAGALFAMWALKQFRKATLEEMFKDRPCLLHRPDVHVRIVPEVKEPLDTPKGKVI